MKVLQELNKRIDPWAPLVFLGCAIIAAFTTKHGPFCILGWTLASFYAAANHYDRNGP